MYTNRKALYGLHHQDLRFRVYGFKALVCLCVIYVGGSEFILLVLVYKCKAPKLASV